MENSKHHLFFQLPFLGVLPRLVGEVEPLLLLPVDAVDQCSRPCPRQPAVGSGDIG